MFNKSEFKEPEAGRELGTTRGLAQFVVDTGFKNIPSEVIEAAKKAFMDCLGVAIAGTLEPGGDIIRSLVQEVEAKPVAGVLGGGFRTAPLLAALANGTQAHLLDYDDSGALPLPFHPSVPILPVALASGEAQNASGKDILLAYILGVEAETKLAAAIKVSHFDHGWHPTATLGTLGATAASAKLLKLEAEQTEIALGIASSLAGGLRQNFGTMTKPLHAGNAAKNGLMATMLARKGFSAAPGILEAPVGFLNVFAGRGEYSTEKLVTSLGEPFHFAHPGVAMKQYPSCRGTHASIEALNELLKDHKILPEEIDKIECAISGPVESDDSLSRPQPKSSLDGKFSVEHCLSVLLLDGEVGLKQFSPERVLNPRVGAMRKRVKVHYVKDLLGETERGHDMAAQVIIKLKDGRQLSHFKRESKEEMGVPWSWEDLIKKFTQCANLALPREGVEELIECLLHLEKVENTSHIVDLALGPFGGA